MKPKRFKILARCLIDKHITNVAQKITRKVGKKLSEIKRFRKIGTARK
jgi:hypothetical protein